MFTTGSTGDPKGVVLTHSNILYNIAQVLEHTGISR
jgi:long-subunit acyl-CoA synthetase (AMP-forming)